MGSATEKQVIALRKFAKNPKFGKGILKGIQFGDLDKLQASELISKCLEQGNNTNGQRGQDKARYPQNFKDAYRIYRMTTLTDEQAKEIREAHKRHCNEILDECRDEYPGEPAVQLAVFDKRCDKIYTWIQQARDDKVRKQSESPDSG